MGEFFQRIGKNATDLILRQLDAASVLRAGATCKWMHALSQDELLWRWLVQRDFNWEIDENGLKVYKWLSASPYRKRTDYSKYRISFYDAIRYHVKRPEIVRAGLRRTNPIIKPEHIMRALMIAIVVRHPEIVKIILTSDRVSIDFDVLRHALDKDNAAVFKLLWLDSRDDREEFREKLLNECAHYQNDIAEILLL